MSDARRYTICPDTRSRSRSRGVETYKFFLRHFPRELAKKILFHFTEIFVLLGFHSTRSKSKRSCERRSQKYVFYAKWQNSRKQVRSLVLTKRVFPLRLRSAAVVETGQGIWFCNLTLATIKIF